MSISATTPTTPPTTATPSTPSVAPVTTSPETKQPQQDLNVPDLLFALTCYCYIHASKLSYAAINELNPNLTVVLDNYSETSEVITASGSAKTLFDEMKKDAEEAHGFAGEDAVPVPSEDTEDEE